MAYWRLHYHLVWATYQRAPLLTEQIEREIYGAVLAKAAEMGVIVHAVGAVRPTYCGGRSRRRARVRNAHETGLFNA